MQAGLTHYKCIQHKTGFRTRFSGSKSRNNALHTDCCKVTIELPAHAVATISVFLPRNRSFAQSLLKLFCFSRCFVIQSFLERRNSCTVRSLVSYGAFTSTRLSGSTLTEIERRRDFWMM